MEEQVILSHSPLKMFRQLLDKHVLVSGQGPTTEIAKHLGFKRITTIETLRKRFPKLDTMDYKRKLSAVSLVFAQDSNFITLFSTYCTTLFILPTLPSFLVNVLTNS